MTATERKRNSRLVWFVPLAIILCSSLANFVGDMIFICFAYGPHAYFDQGVRIVKHKPYTLSTGAVLSDNLNFLGWFTDTVLWLGFVILFMYALVGVYEMFRRFPRGKNEVSNNIH